MRRLLFIDHVDRILGGAEINLLELLPVIRASRSWEPLVACAPGSRLESAVRSIGIETVPHHFPPSLNELRVAGGRLPLAGAWAGWNALRKAQVDLHASLERCRPDAIVSCTNKDHLAAGAAGKRLKIPSYWWVNDIISPDFFAWPVRFAFVEKARRQARLLVVVSEFARDALIREGLAEKQVRVIHNGIPVAQYRSVASGMLRRAIGVDEDEPVIGFVGRLTPWKGPDFFIRLAAEWVRHGGRGHFVLVGQAFNEEQAFADTLRAMVVEHGIQERVHFVTFQKDIAATLSDLTALVHTSQRPEPFGRVLVEAMAAGVPVLAAADGGVPEIIESGVDGLLARPSDLADYMDKLSTLLDGTGVRDRIAAAALKSVERRFSVDRVWRDWESVLAATN